MIASFKNRSGLSILFLTAVITISAFGLTDARGGEHRRILKSLDPAAEQTISRLEQRVTFDLTNASLGDLLNTVSNKTGVAVAQSPEAATSNVQQARFTIHAENFPAHAVLAESLAAFRLSPEPGANGVTIAAANCEMVVRESDETPGKTEHMTKRVVINRESTSDGAIEKHVEIHGDGPMACKISADGTMHRELVMKTDENGVKSEGKLVIDVSGAKAQSK